MGVKTNGARCTFASRTVRDPNAPHLHFCAVHWRTYDVHVETIRQRHPGEDPNHREGHCLHYQRRQFCRSLVVPGEVQCGVHLAQRAEEERRRQEEEALHDRMGRLVDEYRTREPRPTWRQVVDDILQRRDLNAFRPIEWMFVARRYYRDHGDALIPVENEWVFLTYWRWRTNGGVGEPPEPGARPLPPLQTLAGIARDRQNVHTRPVSEQTNRGLQVLLDVRHSHTGTMRCPEWFASKWLLRSYGSWSSVSKVVNDMQGWYAQSSCRAPNDWLYRNALDGLYLKIRSVPSDETKIELYKRTFEECLESAGLCCDGHITRLCNVLVGFDEAFVPPVPFAEILQSKMAAIAASEASTDEKIHQATAFFNEHNVPDGERAAWLDAF